MISIYKSSQVISQELELKSLIKKILHVIMENSTAERVVLIEKVANKWKVSAELERGNKEDEFLLIQDMSIPDYHRLPKKIINYVIHSWYMLPGCNTN